MSTVFLNRAEQIYIINEKAIGILGNSSNGKSFKKTYQKITDQNC
jgi:hypothetical protein